jgi:predicted CxxxxCH...CXXCH cytochrome family protein
VTARLADQVTGAHQVVLFLVRPGNRIALACTCTGCHGNGHGRVLAGSRPSWTAAGALAAWRAWHEREGIEL